MHDDDFEQSPDVDETKVPPRNTNPEDAIAFPTGEALDNLSDDAVIALTRKVRVKAIRDLHSGGSISKENSDRNFITALLNGLDAQAIQNKRIAADQKSNNSNAALISEVLKSIGHNAFKGSAEQAVDVGAKVLPDSFSVGVTAVPGEMDVEPAQMDYGSFVAKNAPKPNP